MAAFSFKERFVPWVKDGSKRQTIRAFRKYPVKVGELAHLFYGMRTKFCTRLVEPAPVIKEVKCIYVSDSGGVALIDVNWIEPGLVSMIRLYGKPEIDGFFGDKVQWLTKGERDKLAWDDGFRHQDKPKMVCDCFDIMERYWRLNGGLPFVGFLSKW